MVKWHDVPWGEFEEEIVRHLQTLVRLDTSNPPGNETLAASYLAGVLRDEGIESEILESGSGRGNLVARLPGINNEEALMLLSHLDVVPAEADKWMHPPFEGVIADGYVWGRGTLDTKNLTVMELMAVILLKRLEVPLRRSVVLVATADEEAGGTAGIKWMLDHHPEWVSAPYVINEGAGYDIHIGNQRFYTCQTGEKGFCRLTVRAKGKTGHAAFRHRGTAITRLGEALARLGGADLPLHSSASAQLFVDLVSRALEPTDPRRALLVRDLLDPVRSVEALKELDLESSLADELYAMFRNTANATIVSAGKTINVIPSSAEAKIDGRLVPGATEESFLAELQPVIGVDYEVVIDEYSTALESAPGSELFAIIQQAMSERDPTAHVVPYLVVGGTDARHIKRRLSSIIYGFKPMRQDVSAPRQALVHGHNERISIDNMIFGTQVVFDIVARFCGGYG